jgi:preprotein translocase subunit SecF
LKLRRRDDLRTITNDSINQTLSRSILTSGLTFLAVAGLYLFGGEVLSGFSLALVIGIIVGSYSTIAIASPIMLWWQQWQTQRQLARKVASRTSLVESKSAAVKKEKNRKVSASQ